MIEAEAAKLGEIGRLDVATNAAARTKS